MLETPRLILRNWQVSDREPFFAMNRDPRVMEFMPRLLSREESDAFIDRAARRMQENGFGLWALERKDNGRFIGFTGLNSPDWEAHFTPCVEIGWRLEFGAWGNGFATEAAMAALRFGFGEIQLEEIVSFTVPANVRSRRVMERIGMSPDHAGDFVHPQIPEGNPLKSHVLYRLSREDWKRSPQGSPWA